MDDDNSAKSCCHYCSSYLTLYGKIKSQGMRWLTISPPISDSDPDVYYDMWFEEFELFRKFVKNIILIVEFSNLRMHFHAVYSVKDKKKEYMIVNRFRKGNMVRVYDGEPKGGIHYLFKDIEVSTELLTKSPIIDLDALNLSVEKRKHDRRQKLLKEKEEKLKDVNNSVPSWMLSGEDTDCSF